MPKCIAGPSFGRNLWKAGVIPDETGDVELHVPVDGIMQLKFVVNVTDEMLPIIGEALMHSHEENYVPTKRHIANTAHREFGFNGERLPVLRDNVATGFNGERLPVLRDNVATGAERCGCFIGTTHRPECASINF